MFHGIEINDRHLGTFTDPLNHDAPPLSGFLSLNDEHQVEAVILVPPGDRLSMAWADPFAEIEIESPTKDASPVTAPRFLSFEGEQGSALLYGCQSNGSRYRTGAGGWATLTAEFAVLNSKDFILNGSCGSLRCEISGLFDWLSRPVLRQMRTYSATTAMCDVDYKLLDQPSIVVYSSEDSQLRLESEYRVASKQSHPLGARTSLESVGNSYTDAFSPMKWRSTFALHFAIRDLISISRWVPEEIVNAFVAFELPDDGYSARTPREWDPIVGFIDTHNPAPQSDNDHLYPFSYLGSEGINKWLTLLDNRYFDRAVRNLVEALRSRTHGARRLQLVGFAIEALSHYINNPENTGERIRFERSCKLVLDYVGEVVHDDVPDEWISKFSDNYNDLKHSEKRYQAGPFEILEFSTFGLYLARLAIGKLIGIPTDALQELKIEDPLYPKKFRYSRSADPSEQWHQNGL